MEISQGCFLLFLLVQSFNGNTFADFIDIEKSPYHVTLISNNKLLCGGALVSDRQIVTAGHCINKYVKNPSLVNSDGLKLLVGASSKHDGVVQKITRIAIHTEFKNAFCEDGVCNYRGDIGIITVAKAIVDPSIVKAINLPQKLEINEQRPSTKLTRKGLLARYKKKPVETEFRISGFDVHDYSWTLEKDMYSELDHRNCRKLVSSSQIVLNDEVTCYKGPELAHITPSGYDGSPVTSKKSGKATLVGIVNYPSASKEALVNVAVNVLRYIDFINEEINRDKTSQAVSVLAKGVDI